MAGLRPSGVCSEADHSSVPEADERSAARGETKDTAGNQEEIRDQMWCRRAEERSCSNRCFKSEGRLQSAEETLWLTAHFFLLCPVVFPLYSTPPYPGPLWSQKGEGGWAFKKEGELFQKCPASPAEEGALFSLGDDDDAAAARAAFPTVRLNQQLPYIFPPEPNLGDLQGFAE